MSKAVSHEGYIRPQALAKAVVYFGRIGRQQVLDSVIEGAARSTEPRLNVRRA